MKKTQLRKRIWLLTAVAITLGMLFVAAGANGGDRGSRDSQKSALAPGTVQQASAFPGEAAAAIALLVGVGAIALRRRR